MQYEVRASTTLSNMWLVRDETGAVTGFPASVPGAWQQRRPIAPQYFTHADTLALPLAALNVQRAYWGVPEEVEFVGGMK